MRFIFMMKTILIQQLMHPMTGHDVIFYILGEMILMDVRI